MITFLIFLCINAAGIYVVVKLIDIDIEEYRSSTGRLVGNKKTYIDYFDRLMLIFLIFLMSLIIVGWVN